MNTKTKNFLSALLALIVAVNLCGLGVGLFVQANLGSDTLTVIQEGMSKTFHISLGNASRLFNIFFLSISLIIARKYIGWCTIVYGLVVGSFIDLYNGFLIPFHIASMSLWIRVLCIIIGQLLLIVTYSLLIKYRSGMNQLDAVCYGLERYLPFTFKHIRTFFDILFIVVGYFMGGVVGVGSLFAMITTGYGIDICLKIMK